MTKQATLRTTHEESQYGKDTDTDIRIAPCRGRIMLEKYLSMDNVEFFFNWLNEK